MDFACAKLLRDAGFARFDAVAGGETAGIPFAAWIAERLALPMLYVRKKPKGFGRDAQIEGAMAEGARVLLVEDLDHRRRLEAALRRGDPRRRRRGRPHLRGLLLRHLPAVRGVLLEHGLRLHCLATWRDVLAEARAGAHFDAGDAGRGRGVPRRAARLVGGPRRRGRGGRLTQDLTRADPIYNIDIKRQFRKSSVFVNLLRHRVTQRARALERRADMAIAGCRKAALGGAHHASPKIDGAEVAAVRSFDGARRAGSP